MSMLDDRESLQKWIVPAWIIYLSSFMLLPVIAIVMDRLDMYTGWVMWTVIVMFAIAFALGYFSAVISKEPDKAQAPVIVSTKKSDAKKKTTISAKDDGSDYVPVKPKASPALKEEPK